MTKIEITIQNGKVTWLEQSGEPLPENLWADLNVAIVSAVERYTTDLIMTRREKAFNLFHRACEHCEEFSTKHKCEIEDTCPVYELYKMAKEKKHIIKPDEWQTPPSPKPEMI